MHIQWTIHCISSPITNPSYPREISDLHMAQSSMHTWYSKPNRYSYLEAQQQKAWSTTKLLFPQQVEHALCSICLLMPCPWSGTDAAVTDSAPCKLTNRTPAFQLLRRTKYYTVKETQRLLRAEHMKANSSRDSTKNLFFSPCWLQ